MQSEEDELLIKIRKWVKEAPRNEETYQKMKTIQGHLMGIIDDEPSKPKRPRKSIFNLKCLFSTEKVNKPS